MRRGIAKAGVVALGLLPGLFFSADASFSAESGAGHPLNALSICWENDAFDATDANYTNGLSMGFTQKGSGVLGGLWDLFGADRGELFSSYEVSQFLYTPLELDISVPDPRDRPYAGILYLGLTTHLQSRESQQSLKIVAGVVGPYSLGEKAQNVSHYVFENKKPQGWGSQLKNEPILNLMYEYRHKIALASTDSWVGIELIPIGGATLGNLSIKARAETQLRIGYHLPNDFGTTLLREMAYLPFPQDARTDHKWGIYAFAGGSASLIARDLTLDGNSFEKGPSVDKRPFVPAVEFGASLWTSRFQTSFTYLMGGKDFYGQRVREDYGSVSFSCFF